MTPTAAQSKTPTVYKQITIRTSDGATIQGKVNLGSNQRVSEIFTTGNLPFIVVVDAFLREGSGKTLIINKKHIVWVEPEED